MDIYDKIFYSDNHIPIPAKYFGSLWNIHVVHIHHSSDEFWFIG
jgi:mannose-6-phosphate isomerase-like protein (cupin superfamily)